MPTAVAVRAIFPILLCPLIGFAWQAIANAPTSDPSRTLFVPCEENDKPKHILSPVSQSENEDWRAYVEVDVRSDLGCVRTTRLWIARGNTSYRLVYLIPPERTAVANGMEILGWARNSSMLLVKTEKWQEGSDAQDEQQILAIDARTGTVYEPNLDAMLQAHKDKQCWFRLTGAGFGPGREAVILVRASFSTAVDVGDTEADVPPSKRCGSSEETWSFDFDSGEIKRLPNVQPLELFKNFLPNQLDR